jgi:(p)ppGpp synthase/HD superfamily hydrolase
MIGYSDRINHAFAFAAKHHDRQVRKGARAPYLTHPANVALILTRYGCAEETVIAGILHDLVEDCVRDGWTREELDERIGSKFGAVVLETALAVTKRRLDDEGVELSRDDIRADYVKRLAGASDSARWLCAADKVHNAGSILADLRRTIDAENVWGRVSGGRDATLLWYRGVYDRLSALGFSAPIMKELSTLVDDLERV